MCGFLGNYIVAALICFLLPEKTEADRHHRFISSAEGNDQIFYYRVQLQLDSRGVWTGTHPDIGLIFFFSKNKKKRTGSNALD